MTTCEAHIAIFLSTVDRSEVPEVLTNRSVSFCVILGAQCAVSKLHLFGSWLHRQYHTKECPITMASRFITK